VSFSPLVALHKEVEDVMKGCNVGVGVVILAMSLVLSLGCAGSRSGCRNGGCRASSPARAEVSRSVADQPKAADRVVRANEQQNCPVTGEKLGSMGSPISVSVNGRTIQVCCQGCVSAVRKNPDKYLKVVDDELGRPQVPISPRASVSDRTSLIGSEVTVEGGHHH
jgi:YHS domain-containing protein